MIIEPITVACAGQCEKKIHFPSSSFNAIFVAALRGLAMWSEGWSFENGDWYCHRCKVRRRLVREVN